jgi:TonB family protein
MNLGIENAAGLHGRGESRLGSWIASTALHVFCAGVLASIRYSPVVSEPATTYQRVRLTAPVIPRPERRPGKQSVRTTSATLKYEVLLPANDRNASAQRPEPKRFSPPQAQPRISPKLEESSLPAIQASVPPPSSIPARLPVLAAPTWKTDNFDFAGAARTADPLRGELRTGSFGSSDATPARSDRTGAIASAGFDSIEQSKEAGTKRSIAKAGFGDMSAQAERIRRANGPAPAATTPVEILYKPRPEYTAEARKLGIEGEVLVEVLFSTRGQTESLRVIQGLGYGLDEAALDAARSIRFRPATRGGEPVDSIAVIHIRFQLAF